MSLLVPTSTPLATYPVLSRAPAQMHVFAGFPDEQAWLEEALAQVDEQAPGADGRKLLELGPLAWGAPLGDFTHESFRVARTTGVFVEENEEGQEVTGVALAHARCWAYWMPSEDGPLLTLEFQEPTCFAWGVGKDRLAQEQLKISCIHQLKRQCASLLENVADTEQAVRLNTIFTGEWDETTLFLQTSLTHSALKAWHQATLPQQSSAAEGEADAQSQAA